MKLKKQNRARGAALRRISYGILVLLLIVAVGAGAALLPDMLKNGQQTQSNVPTYAVERGPLMISVTETGTIQPREQLVLKSEVEGQTTILFLVDEGTHVKKGDLLVELDASNLIDQRVDQQIIVQNAEAAFVQARENLEIVKNQAQADIEKAELDHDFAQQDITKYEEGEYPNLLKEAETKITLAQETLSQAQREVEWSRKLFEEKYLAQSDLQQDELTAKKSELDLELAKQELDLLKEYTYKRQMAELSSNLRQTDMALERVKRKASADIVQAEAELKAKQAEFKQQQDKLTKLETQIAKAKIIAPMDGMVVYATSSEFSWRGNTEPLDEGQTVRERQELIHLPTTSAFNAEVKIHEASLKKVRVGLPTQIKVDAVPGQVYHGRVAVIAPLPDAQSVFMNPDLKVYRTVIEINGGGEELRNGMSCSAEIVVDNYPGALFVPIQAVLRVAGQPTVYVRKGDVFEPRPIIIGLDNNRMVHVKEGVKEGELVMLTPPLDAARSAEPAFDVNAETGGGPSAGQTQGEGAGSQPGVPAGNGIRTTGPSPTADTGQPPAGEAAQGAGDAEQDQRRRERFQNMSPEEREQMRQRFQNMSPEEREQMRQRRRDGGGGGRGEAQ